MGTLIYKFDTTIAIVTLRKTQLENHRQHCRLCCHARNNFWRWKLQRVLSAVPHCPGHETRKVWLVLTHVRQVLSVTSFIIHTHDEWARLTTADDPLLITRYFSSLHFPSPVTVKQMIMRGIAKMWHTFLLANWSDRLKWVKIFWIWEIVLRHHNRAAKIHFHYSNIRRSHARVLMKR